MPRIPSNPAPWMLSTTLLAGIVLGMAIDRGGSRLSAQATPPPRATSATAPSPAAVAVATEGRGAGEAAVYDELARQYERFQPGQPDVRTGGQGRLAGRRPHRRPQVVHVATTGPSPHYEETGSGVIVRAEKGKTLYVLTNNHVVEGAASADVQIFLQDGRAIRPERAWCDSRADVAVLKLGRDDLPAAQLGNSDDAAVGTWVLALGSPFGLTHSVTQGIISARGRHEKELESDGVENQDFLQTDAAINPGNSGGPLVNMKGEVIGINTAIASNGGGSEGVGFSIPINLARWIMTQLVASGRVSRGAMGVDLEDLKADQATRLGLERPRGAQVKDVHPGSPAAKAGLKVEDVVVRFNGVTVTDLNHLINLVSMAPIGAEAEVVIWRGGREQVKSVTVADRDLVLAGAPTAGVADATAASRDGLLRRPPRPSTPAADANTAKVPALGLELVTLDPTSAKRLNLPESLRGVAVAKVDPNGPLAAYFRPLDVIASAAGRPIRTADEAVRALTKRADRGGALEVVVQRLIDGNRQRLTVRVP